MLLELNAFRVEFVLETCRPGRGELQAKKTKPIFHRKQKDQILDLTPKSQIRIAAISSRSDFKSQSDSEIAAKIASKSERAEIAIGASKDQTEFQP